MKCVKCKKRFNPLGMQHLACADAFLCKSCYALWLKWYHSQVGNKSTIPEVWSELWQAFLTGKTVEPFVFR